MQEQLCEEGRGEKERGEEEGIEVEPRAGVGRGEGREESCSVSPQLLETSAIWDSQSS